MRLKLLLKFFLRLVNYLSSYCRPPSIIPNEFRKWKDKPKDSYYPRQFYQACSHKHVWVCLVVFETIELFTGYSGQWLAHIFAWIMRK